MADPTFTPLPLSAKQRNFSRNRWIIVGVGVALMAGAVVNALKDDPTSTDDLKIGMCLKTLPGDHTFTTIDDVGCDKPHIAEVYDKGTFVLKATLPSTLGTLDLNVGGDDVGDPFIEEAVQRVCVEEQASARRQALIDADASVTYFQQTGGISVVRAEIFCVASFDEARSGSVTSLS
jgi:hypothetical protein